MSCHDSRVFSFKEANPMLVIFQIGGTRNALVCRTQPRLVSKENCSEIKRARASCHASSPKHEADDGGVYQADFVTTADASAELLFLSD